MVCIELIDDRMCDMSSCMDTIKSTVRFRWFVIILQDQFFHPSPPLTPNLMASLVALVYSIINFMIHLLQTHLFR